MICKLINEIYKLVFGNVKKKSPARKLKLLQYNTPAISSTEIVAI